MPLTSKGEKINGRRDWSLVYVHDNGDFIAQLATVSIYIRSSIARMLVPSEKFPPF